VSSGRKHCSLLTNVNFKVFLRHAIFKAKLFYENAKLESLIAYIVAVSKFSYYPNTYFTKPNAQGTT